jgi:hypothetical protein
MPGMAATKRDSKAFIGERLAEDPTWRPWDEDLARVLHEDADPASASDFPTPEEEARYEAEFNRIGEGALGGIVGVGRLNDYKLRLAKGERLRNTRGEPLVEPVPLHSPKGYFVWPLEGGPTGKEVAQFSFLKGDWMVSGTIAHSEGALQVYSISMEPRPARGGSGAVTPASGISGRVLNGVKPVEIVKEVQRALERLPKAVDSWDAYWDSWASFWQTRGLDQPPSARALRSEVVKLRRRVQGAPLRLGRKGYPESLYRALADAHVKACRMIDEGHPAHVMELTADLFVEIFGEPYPATASGMKDAIRKAQTLGFLTPATNGKAGRTYGPKFFTQEDS